MKTIKIDFSKLIGNHYSLEMKMFVLDWMLRTGEEHTQSSGKWTTIGVGQALFSYSANQHDYKKPLPETDQLEWFFDAIFARAIFMPANKALKEWREKENIYAGKYRMLNFNDEYPKMDQPYLSRLISDLQKFTDKSLKKEFAHPDYPDRVNPKILRVCVFTLGYGWIVQYDFSFSGEDYKWSKWTNGFRQEEDESISCFLKRCFDEINNRIQS